VLILYFDLKPPRDNALIWPVILTIPPFLATWICRFRWPKEFWISVVVTAILTFVITQLFIKVTGVSTGVAEGAFNRAVPGLLAAAITKRVAVKFAEVKESRRD
jgi:energy-converting hydrogenase Eha subunit A